MPSMMKAVLESTSTPALPVVQFTLGTAAWRASVGATISDSGSTAVSHSISIYQTLRPWPDFAQVRLGSEVAGAYDSCRLLVSYLDEDEAVSCVGFLVFVDAPVEVIGEDAFHKVEVVQEIFDFVA